MAEEKKITLLKDGTNIIPESNSLMMYNSIVRIEYKLKIGEEVVGTGFFMKIPHENTNEYFNFLVTNCHVIPESIVEEKKEIDIFFGNSKMERNRKIDLDRNKRYIKCNKDCDYTVIQILNRDNISNGKYLYPEPNYKKGCEFYLNKPCYLAGYPIISKNKEGFLNKKLERCISPGKITRINKVYNYDFEHYLETKNGSSGSPICSIDDGKVIGIHKGGIKQFQINFGTFIGFIINDFEKPYMGQRQSSIKDFPFNGQNIHQIKLTSKEVELIINSEKVLEKFLNLCHLAEKYALRIGNKENEIEYFGNYCFHSFCKNSSIEELFNILKKENEQFKYIANEFCSKHLESACKSLKSFAPQIFIKLKSLLKNENEKRIFDDIINFINKII